MSNVSLKVMSPSDQQYLNDMSRKIRHSKEDYKYFDPDEYQISVTLSEQLNILPVPELAFQIPP